MTLVLLQRGDLLNALVEFIFEVLIYLFFDNLCFVLSVDMIFGSSWFDYSLTCIVLYLDIHNRFLWCLVCIMNIVILLWPVWRCSLVLIVVLSPTTILFARLLASNLIYALTVTNHHNLGPLPRLVLTFDDPRSNNFVTIPVPFRLTLNDLLLFFNLLIKPVNHFDGIL